MIYWPAIAARLDSAFAGEAIFVGALLLSSIAENRRFVVRWFRDGLTGNARDGQMAASVFVFSGIMIYVVKQVAARSLNVVVVDTRLNVLNLVAYGFLGYGNIIWSASVIAAKRGPHAGRAYLWLLCVMMVAAPLIAGLSNPFHRQVYVMSPGSGR